jgi:hypothetical protein
MRTPRSIVALGATAALGAPAGTALAADESTLEPPARPGALAAAVGASNPTIGAAMREHVRDGLVTRYHRTARRAGHRPAHAARRWETPRLRRELRSLRREIQAAAARPTGVLASIAECESGSNPRAVGGGGTYRGMYQFSLTTWRAVGGKGDPVNASVGEQTRRARILYARSGPGQWPVCGR